MRFWIKLLLLVMLIIGCCTVIAGRVSTKLDFGEEGANPEEQKDSSETNNGMPSNVRGVRVTVETKTDTKGSPESKSSESSDSNSSDRSSIGVRTDVTFEISNETNETRSQEDIAGKKKKTDDKNKKKGNADDDDDDDIPIIKGRTTPPKKQKESNDITTWRPLVRPIFPKPDDSIRNRANVPSNIPWTKTFQSNGGVWTTERNYFGLFDNYNNFNPSQPTGTHIAPHNHRQQNINPPSVQFYPYALGQPSWQACRCDLLHPNWNPTAFSTNGVNVNRNKNQFHYTLVDDKLEEPFSVSNHNQRRRESRES